MIEIRCYWIWFFETYVYWSLSLWLYTPFTISRACIHFHHWDGLTGLTPTEYLIFQTFSFILRQNCLHVSSLDFATCMETISVDWELGLWQTHKMTQIGTSHLGPYWNSPEGMLPGNPFPRLLSHLCCKTLSSLGTWADIVAEMTARCSCIVSCAGMWSTFPSKVWGNAKYLRPLQLLTMGTVAACS